MKNVEDGCGTWNPVIEGQRHCWFFREAREVIVQRGRSRLGFSSLTTGIDISA